MASFVYGMAKKVMMGIPYSTSTGVAVNGLSLTNSNIYAILVKTSYTADQDASTTTSIALIFAARPNANSVTSDAVLNNVSVTHASGVTTFDADDIAFPSVSSGAIIGGIVIYQRKNNDADSFPIAFIDTNDATANGASININWDNGANKIFALT